MIFSKKVSIFLLSLILLNVLLLSLEETSGEFRVHFLDVGQGDSIFIETPKGFQILIDGGKGASAVRELGKLMSTLDKDIDVVIATHADADHIGGLIPVFDKYNVSTFIHNGKTKKKNTGVARNLLQRVKDEKAKVIVIDKRAVLKTQDGVVIDFFWPLNVDAPSGNEGSITTKIVYRDAEVLLTGDLSSSVENKLVDVFGSRLKSDVLKLGHHGSSTSSSGKFLDAVSPKVVIVSAGENNSFGHPREDVITRVKERGIERFDTKDGTKTFVSSGGDLY